MKHIILYQQDGTYFRTAMCPGKELPSVIVWEGIVFLKTNDDRYQECSQQVLSTENHLTPGTELYGLYHTLWTKAVGKAGYDKKEWLLFGELINKL